MNKESDSNHMTQSSYVILWEEAIEKVTWKDLIIVIKTIKAARPCEVCADMISASGE